ncbi:putative glycolipid-binding domain-containing protein [Rapidithrix thailandica]|uniref:Glycolipid-binding domain-containing protein n=1 Tax=Rapidithrix thailandica TaxID=413964 RepID=A0AAW9S4J3_9BACT
MNKTIRWQGISIDLAETLTITEHTHHFSVESQLKGILQADSIDIRYQVQLEKDWTWKEFYLHDTQGEVLRVIRSAQEPAFENCEYIDFRLTPFTNTLPIRHLQLETGEKKEIRVIYIAYPKASLQIMRQEYTKLDEGKYFYKNFDTNFESEISTDAEGFVIEYPNLFKQV